MADLFISPVVRAISSTGATLSGAKLYFYATDSLDPAAIYTSDDLGTEHPNPVVADAGGLFEPIYLDPGVVYRVILKTSAGVPIQDVDPYNSVPDEQTYLVHGQFLGPDPPEPQQLLSGQMIPDDVTVTFAENFNGDFWFHCITPPSDDFVISVRQDGVEIGTITVDDTGAAAALVDASTFTGGRISFFAPDTSTAIAEFFWTVRGTVTEAGA